MSETSKSPQAIETDKPQYEPESPAPEQQNAAIENANRLVLATMNEIRENIPSLSQEQYGEIQRSLYREAEAFLQSNQDVYGEPNKVQESEAEKAFGSNTIATDGANTSSLNPYESHFR